MNKNIQQQRTLSISQPFLSNNYKYLRNSPVQTPDVIVPIEELDLFIGAYTLFITHDIWMHL